MLGDKRVLVTGAAGGMGREIAVECARQGATQIGVTDLNDLKETAKLVEAEGAEVYAVTEQRTLGEGRTGIDGQDRHLALPGARVLEQPADQRRLAHAGRTGEPHHLRSPRPRVDLTDQRPPLRVVVLDERYRPCQSAPVAREQALGEIGGGASGGRHRPGNSTWRRPPA